MCLLAGALLANVLLPPPLDRAYNTSTIVSDKDGQWLSVFPVEEGRWRIKSEVSDIDPRFLQYLLAIEDKRFYRHSGVDPLAVLRALRSWRRAGRAVSGASTLTMQLVRQLEPRERTLLSKMIETLRAVQIEVRLSKPEILSLYLTHTPYGGNIEGLEAAALVYFGKHADQLTNAQIALLIALPQAPEARRPDRHPGAAKSARDVILQKLYSKGMLTQIELREAREETIPTTRHEIAQTSWLTSHKLRTYAKPQNKSVVSSLDRNLQEKAEQLSANYTQDLRFNVSVLVIDNHSMKVRAHIGSAGRNRPGGWIDMTARPRSPGSTLKPFIYGFSFDDGLSAPGSFILDAPTRFGSYQPENFNRRYHGQIKIHEALAHSLNVPAVLALDQVGSNRFETALALSGTPTQSSNKTAGLALALGGAGLRSEDLAVLYAGLANGGKVRPLLWLEDQRSSSSYQMMRPASVQKITEILRQAPTPGGRVPHWLVKNAHPIAYKTGTSYGFRDAWAAGYTDQWTVIVWVGRPDGAPRIGQTGRIAAAPLLFDIFAVLPRPGSTQFFKKIEDAPRGLQNFGAKTDTAPQLLFPPDGAEIAVSEFGEQARGLTLSARSSGREALNWYVDGTPIKRQTYSGRPIWKPSQPGFYTLSVVDISGASTRATVRVMAISEM